MTVNTPTTSTDEATFCYRHPTVETALRCITCNRYICSKCAMRTPVGYRCPECIRNQQNVYFTINQTGYVIAGLVAFALAIPAVFVLSKLGLFLVIILGIPTGGVISEAVARAIRKQRGRYTWLVVAVAVVLGGLAVTLFDARELLTLIGTAAAERRGFGELLLNRLAPGLLMTALVAFTASARFRYGK
jgi:hypothetical protein